MTKEEIESMMKIQNAMNKRILTHTHKTEFQEKKKYEVKNLMARLNVESKVSERLVN